MKPIRAIFLCYIMDKKSKILIACEESGTVTDAFIDIGFTNVWSCDLEPCSGKNPSRHLQQDVIPLLSQEWDMIIAFPMCTHLAVSGARHFAEKRKDGRQQQGIDFFMAIANSQCEKIAIENPVGIMSTKWRKPDQIVQPWMFGHTETKALCLWLKGLPELTETNNVKKEMDKLPKKDKHKVWYASPGKDRAKLRSKTFQGLAQAMATQWG